MTSLIGSVVDIVRLRRWAIELLGRTADESHLRAIIAVGQIPLESWESFIRLERCAEPLVSALTTAGTLSDLPEPVRRLLSESARRDAERALCAQRDGRWIGRMAETLGLRAIVLKGGVPTLQGMSPVFHLADLDILVPPGALDRWSDALRGAGYICPELGLGTLHHHAWYHESDRLPIEIHWTLHSTGQAVDADLWERVVPLEG